MSGKLVDIGNGFQVAVDDPNSALDQQVKYLGMLDLVQKVKNNPFEQAKIQAEVENKALEGQIKTRELQQKENQLYTDSFLSAVSGDYRRANELIQSVNPNLIVEPHPNVAKRNRNVMIVRDMSTGQVQERDPYADLRITEETKKGVAIVQKAKELALENKYEREKWERNTGMKLAEEGFVNTPAEGMKLASSYSNMISRAEKAGVPLRKMEPEALQNRFTAGAEYRAAEYLDQNNPVNQPMVKKTPIPETARVTLEGEKAYQNFLAQDLLPRYRELQDKIMSNPNLINMPVQRALEYLGANDPRFLAFKTILGEGLFNHIKSKSGAAFTDQEYSRRAALLPTGSETVGNALAKISAQLGMSSMNAINQLNSLEASGHRVENQRRLFQGKDYGDVTMDSTEQAAKNYLNALPPEIKQDRERMNELLQSGVSPNFRQAIMTEMRKEKEKYLNQGSGIVPGTPTDPQGALNKLRSIRQNKLNIPGGVR